LEAFSQECENFSSKDIVTHGESESLAAFEVTGAGTELARSSSDDPDRFLAKATLFVPTWASMRASHWRDGVSPLGALAEVIAPRGDKV